MLERFQQHLDNIQALLGTIQKELVPLLKPLEEVTGYGETDIEALIKQAEETILENRKVVLAVVGQVKVGKSTLLNSLLFEGKPVLPTAVTPMTARLTIIRGLKDDEAPGAEIVFYSQQDWNEICERAKMETQVDLEVVQPAQRKLGDKIRLYLGTKKSVGVAELDDYVSADGKFFDIVKYAELRFAEMPFPELVVVDTPGLNDPVRSREEQTLKFLKDADAVLFLSSPHRFLDREDMQLVLRDMIRAGIEEVLVVVPQMDTLSPAQRDDFMKSCYERMSDRAMRFARDAGFGPLAQELAKEAFVPRNAVLVSAMAYILAKKLEQNERLDEDERYYLQNMRENGWPTDSPERLEEESRIAELARKIDTKVVARKDAILLRGAFANIEVKINEIAAHTERRLEETKDDLEKCRLGVNELKRQKEAERAEFEMFKEQVQEAMADFQSDIERFFMEFSFSSSDVRVECPTVVKLPWFDKEEEESKLAEEIILSAREELRRKAGEIMKGFEEILRKFEDHTNLIMDSLKARVAVRREIDAILSTFFKRLRELAKAKRLNVSVKFSYGFFDRLVGDAKEIAQKDVRRATKEAKEKLTEALEGLASDLQDLALESVESLRRVLQKMLAERNQKVEQVESALIEQQIAERTLEQQYRQQLELLQKIKQVVDKIEPWLQEIREDTVQGE